MVIDINKRLPRDMNSGIWANVSGFCAQHWRSWDNAINNRSGAVLMESLRD